MERTSKNVEKRSSWLAWFSNRKNRCENLYNSGIKRFKRFCKGCKWLTLTRTALIGLANKWINGDVNAEYTTTPTVQHLKSLIHIGTCPFLTYCIHFQRGHAPFTPGKPPPRLFFLPRPCSARFAHRFSFSHHSTWEPGRRLTYTCQLWHVTREWRSTQFNVYAAVAFKV